VAEEKHGPVLRYAIAAAAAITAAYLGSLIGTGGTLIGTGAGAAISGAAAELYGHLAGQAKRRTWRTPAPSTGVRLAAGAAVFAAAAYGALWAVEAASGRPLHAVTTGADQRGSSFTGAVPYTPPPSQSPAYTPAVVTATPTASPSLSPSQTPSASLSASPMPTPAAQQTGPSPSPTAPASASPAPAPSLLPPSMQPATPYPPPGGTPY